MTHSNSSPDPGQNRPQPPFWGRLLWVGGGLTLLGVAVTGWWAWRFVHTQLAPLVSENLAKTFDRTVQVGPVESIGLNQLSFGPSEIPATATDSDRAKLESVQVKFNLLELLWDRRLSLDVTLIRPDIYLAQDKDGLWIATQIKQEDSKPGPIKIELDSLHIKDGTAQLAAYGEVESSKPVEPDGVKAKPQDESAPATLPRALAVNSVVGLQDLNGTVTFRNDNKLIAYDVLARPDTGGNLHVAGRTDLSNPDASLTDLKIVSNNLLAPDISLLVPLPLKLQAGRLATNLAIQFPPNNQPLQFDGKVQLQNIVGRLDGAPKPFEQVNGNLLFKGQQIAFQDFRGQYGAIPVRVGGWLDSQKGYDLKVQAPKASVAEILTTLDLKPTDLPVAVAGVFGAEARMTGPIDRPLIAGTVRNLEPVQLDRVRFAQTQADFSVTPQTVLVNRFRAVPIDGGLITAKAEIELGERGGVVADIQANSLPGDAIARAYGASAANFTVGAVDATAQVFGPLNNVQTLVQWQAPQATYPGRGKIAIAGSRIRFDDTAVLAAGGIVRGSGQIQNGGFQALLKPEGIELAQFNPELRGLFSGNFRLGGRLDNLNPAAIQAEGDLRLSQGIAIITQPLTASVRWLGDRLQILQASATGFRGDGFIFAQLAGTPAIDRLDLNVDLNNYRLSELPVTIPPQFQVAGTTDFSGKITGALEDLTIAGRLGLNHLAVNSFAFEQRLAGDLRFVLNQGLSLDVAGLQDRIAVQLDERNRPRSFYIRQQDTIAQGQSQGDRLLASLDNFPLMALNLRPAANLGPVAGQLNGNFDINLANLSNPAVIGDVAISNPAIDYISADSLKARFRYINGAVTLDQEAELAFRNSLYLLGGSYNPGTDPQLRASVRTEQGRVEDIFALLQWFELADLGRLGPPVFGKATDVATVKVGMADATLLNQLRRYSEINALKQQQQQARANSSYLPDLSTLQGDFTGQVSLAYSARTGPTVDAFKLEGQDWLWGGCLPANSGAANSEAAGNSAIPATAHPRNCPPSQQYRVDQVRAEGNYRNGILTLLPVSLESGDSKFRFVGQLLGPEQSGQLVASNVPAAAVRDLFRLPVDVTGNLNATAQVGGSIANPNFDGELTLADGTVNQTKLDATLRTLFGYNNARLNLDSRFVAATGAAAAENLAPAETTNPVASPGTASVASEPLTSDPTSTPSRLLADAFLFTGSIPYKLPFATVEPETYEANLNLNVRNDGLSLINLFTDQITWKGGDEGSIQLQVAGELPPDQLDFGALTASGQASFTNAQIAAKALPQDLTNVTGTVLFEQDRIRIEKPLEGYLGNGSTRRLRALINNSANRASTTAPGSDPTKQRITVTGVLPLQYALRPDDPDLAHPLVVGLNDLSIQVANFYDGDVTGQVLVTGAALAPKIGGRLTLSNGRILIPNPQANLPTAVPLTTDPTAEPTPFSGFNQRNGVISPPEFEALQISLGNRLRVTYDPVLSFLVQGDLLVTGTQPDPLLDGVVRLRSGQVNLFTTQFNLARGYQNTAQFDSSRGLDPNLDIQLVTSVPEVTRFPSQPESPFPVSEIIDDAAAGDFGAIQTVRVQANVTGPASQLFNNLELTSSPRRSQTEILALLGGGLIGGNATTAIASLVGSPLLTGLQNFINDQFGISDFRLFPTTIISPDSRTTSLALATELGVDITRDLSVSVLQLLTVREKPQFSLRYRLTDQLLLRGSTNFDNESRAVLEFETRF